MTCVRLAPVTVAECRALECKLVPGENGDFCNNHWKLISLETRSILLKEGGHGVGRNSQTRSKALFNAAVEIRAKQLGIGPSR